MVFGSSLQDDLIDVPMEGVIRKTGELLHLVEVIVDFFSRLSIAFGVGVRVA